MVEDLVVNTGFDIMIYIYKNYTSGVINGRVSIGNRDLSVTLIVIMSITIPEKVAYHLQP
jgi:hypothetical protein